MKKTFYILNLLCLVTNIYSQVNFEVDGKVKINNIEKNNSVDSVVVRQVDGTLAVRDVSTLTEYQILSISNDTINLSNGGFIKLPQEIDGSTTNELQTISRTGLTVTLSNDGGTFQDSVLTESEVDNMVSNNGFLTSELDGSPTNELQTLSVNGNEVSLSNGGGTVSVPAFPKSYSFNGYTGSIIPAGATQYSFVGPTTNVTLATGQRICGSAAAGLATTSGIATCRVGMGYSQEGSTQVNNFVGGSYINIEIDQTRTPVAVEGCTVALIAGTYVVGFVVTNDGTIDINSNDYVNGWVFVTE